MAGDQVPLSLTPARRFSIDSNRSPAWATTASTAGEAAASQQPAAKEPAPPGRRPAPARAMPPTSPDQVLPGLIRGASFGPPTVRPTK